MKSLCLCAILLFGANLLQAQAIMPVSDKSNSARITDIVKMPDGGYRLIIAADQAAPKEKNILIVVNDSIARDQYIARIRSSR